MEPERAGRRLAAIMFTDIVGYTALMAQSEEKGLRARERHRALVRPLVERYHGESIEARGDESLSLFSSALNAVSCALAIQEELADDEQLRLHIGIHSSEVVMQAGEVSGDGVNIAARICALSDGDAPFVSAEVHQAVRNQPHLEATPLGDRELKNVGRPVAVFRMRGEAGAPSPDPTSTAAPARGPIKSLAVLPLENLSGDPSQEYFADGMTEALIGDLAQIGSLRVISRTSIMQYKGARRPLPEIARELNVEGIIEGTVLRAGERVRITAQLIRASTDEHIWAERYDRDLTDVLALQSEVAEAVAREVEAKLTPRERVRLANVPVISPEAHDAYLKGRERLEAGKFSEEGLRSAIEYFLEAIASDPSYARAHAALGQCYFYLGQPVGAAPHRWALQEARASALRALELDDDVAEAHEVLSAVKFNHERDYPGAEREGLRAIALDPGCCQLFAIFLAARGRHEEARVYCMRAAESDPLSLGVKTIRAECFFYARQHDRAIEACARVLDIDPGNQRAHRLLRWAHELLGQYEEAIVAYREGEQLSSDETARLEKAFAGAGASGYWQFQLERLQESFARTGIGLGKIAKAHLGLGQTEAALDRLEEAYEVGDSQLTVLKVHPHWDPLRAEPRFIGLLEKLRFLG